MTLDAVYLVTFADVPASALLLYLDSYGNLALAVNRGSATERLGVPPATGSSCGRRDAGIRHAASSPARDRVDQRRRAGARRGRRAERDDRHRRPSVGGARAARSCLVGAGGKGAAVLAVVRGLGPEQALLPLAVPVAVCEAIESVGGARCEIKWPNDVWIDERKVAGVLIEARLPEWAVIGVGVNVSIEPGEFP